MSALSYVRPLGSFGANCYIVACPVTRACVVIDPGTPDPWINETLDQHGLQLTAILLTHAHLDHIGGVAALKKATDAPVLVHPEDAPLLTNPALNGSLTFGAAIVTPPADGALQDGQMLEVGTLRLKVLHTPGHTRGGVCFYLANADGDGGDLYAGDTLFAGSIGRTDLPGGSFETLLESIRTKLLTLPGAVVVYPGHGPSTTIGDEQEYNPFL